MQADFLVVMITMVMMAMILLPQPSDPIFKYVKGGKEFEKLGTAKAPFRVTNKSQKKSPEISGDPRDNLIVKFEI